MIFIAYFIGVVVLVSINLYYAADFLDYLRKSHPSKYRKVVNTGWVGFPGHPLMNPVIQINVLRYLFSADNLGDEKVSSHKRRLRLLYFALVAFFVFGWMVIGLMQRTP